MPHGPNRTPTLASRIVRRIILAIWYLRGWKIDSPLPRHLKKYVIAGAPHTTNWDFVFFTGATHEEGVKPNFMGKHTLFTGFMRNFMLDMGGIPVDRTAKANATEQVAAEFAARDELALVIACEGTRKTDGKWRSGFYHIARAADVPIVPAFADNVRKIIEASARPADAAHQRQLRRGSAENRRMVPFQASRLRTVQGAGTTGARYHCWKERCLNCLP